MIEVYGPPHELAELEELAAGGWRYRRSGPAVAIMGAEQLDGEAPEGMRRPANLEDAFVALTGREHRMSLGARRRRMHRLEPTALAGVMTP